ncbi:NAD(P)-dependent oxidoreductase [Raphidocelis subcapitata]|uniref:NAD(P)-dependent oxidoreductase n=1 Tax=Raphidocelis subcapitata TaxID=307507 RepID=A0A2V0PAH1_9CHLO|nr:NAD(P)-dependent oxidoreductase [Raphidocelis subcapitata]|eukprot:GBF94167.1 NAD(P)-dependent oxidoreductase [Raphidocelis subcapitata]
MEVAEAVSPARAQDPEKAAHGVLPMQQGGSQPGVEAKMIDKPIHIRETYQGSGKLQDKVAIITGGDSGIGRAVALHFAREGAHVAILYLNEHQDAKETEALVQKEGRKCLLFAGDVGDEKVCQEVVSKTVSELGRLDILVNNASEQHVSSAGIEDVPPEQLERVMRTNVFGYFFMAKAALPHTGEGASIINTLSVEAYQGMPSMVPYAASKGAELAFTRSLAASLVKKGIRVNGVAPGPVLTPLVTSTFSADMIASIKSQTKLGRMAMPAEIAPTYVLLASQDGSYITGHTFHPDGGMLTST